MAPSHRCCHAENQTAGLVKKPEKYLVKSGSKLVPVWEILK